LKLACLEQFGDQFVRPNVGIQRIVKRDGCIER
jgi:hypothetical protein